MANLLFSGLILITVMLNTLAQVLLKSGSGGGLINPYLMGGVLTYGVSTLIYITVLSKINLSVAYPVVIGLTVIATTLAGTVLLKEQVSITGWIGIGLMISGIAAIAFGKTFQ
ncbi:MAG: SMR family transporter [Cyanobacteria bacterium J06559_3]